MRGISYRLYLSTALLRFNPAYAGNICLSLALIAVVQVQPRVCGEYSTLAVVLVYRLGSTPRMRGISIITRLCTGLRRFNPAYAGNIFGRLELVNLHIGSTPRMRGIFICIIFNRYWLRFNPAYAGNIQKTHNPAILHKVQPRVCGEYL